MPLRLLQASPTTNYPVSAPGLLQSGISLLLFCWDDARSVTAGNTGVKARVQQSSHHTLESSGIYAPPTTVIRSTVLLMTSNSCNTALERQAEAQKRHLWQPSGRNSPSVRSLNRSIAVDVLQKESSPNLQDRSVLPPKTHSEDKELRMFRDIRGAYDIDVQACGVLGLSRICRRK